MHCPEYHGGSIVNLMSTIATHFGGSLPYPPLESLPPDRIAGAENVVLLIIDGLGFSYLQEHGTRSMLYAHLRGKMTSVFPSTTAAAVSTFYTGIAPQNHGIMGWFTYLRELGLVSVILKTTVRATKKEFLKKSPIPPSAIFQVGSFFDKIRANGFVILPRELLPSPYNAVLAGSAHRIGHRNLTTLFSHVTRILKKNPSPN